ncbi:MAG: L,D-transpeptidase family protein [Roseovarius sp.]
MRSTVFGSSLRALGLAATLSLTGVAFAAPAHAFGEITSYKTAVAEAAADDRDIAAFYRSVDFAPVWTGSDEESRARRSALFSAMATAHMHGLPAQRYDSDRLMAVLSDIRTPRERGMAEVEMSKAFIQLARDMQSGVLNPAEVDDGIKRKGNYRDATTYLTGIMEHRPRAYFRSIVPQTREYARLMKEKMRLQTLIAEGGWGPSVPASALKLGDRGDAVIALRNRLMSMGYLPRTSTLIYDGNIEKAVSRFQADHGLEPDGAAGSATLTEINREPGQRLAQVLVAMERERWLNKERGSRHILVNLTDFSARIIDNDAITFETRAVVGANDASRRSPEFSDVMEHMVINPTWNVPRSIAVNEYLPQLRANPNAAGHLRLYDGSGRQVSRAGINFGAYTASNFPFDLKQPPSNSNALGLVKFMFPNQYNIYLHDTPTKHLFQRAKRAYSHGCIRLAQPFEFAYQLLARQEADPEGFFHSVLDTGQETQVDLVEQVPVHIIYRTAFTDQKGRAQYREDVYGRDARIWAFLEQAGVTAPGVANPSVAAVQYVQPAQVAVNVPRNTQPVSQPQNSFEPVVRISQPQSSGVTQSTSSDPTRRIDR